MTYQDCFLTVATTLLDWDIPVELLPLTITNQAASLVGWEAERRCSSAWD